MGPIDYTIDVQNPIDSAMKGMGQMAQVAQIMQAGKQQEAAQLALQQRRERLNALANLQNPTAKDYAKAIVEDPDLSEHFNRSWSILDKDQQQVRLSQAVPVYAALESEQPEVARKLLDEQATAYRNSGDEEKAKQAEVMSKLIEANPGQAKRSVGLMLAANMGPDKFESTFSGMATTDRADDKLPSELKEQEAKAESAAVAARFAESKAAQDLQKGGWDIKKLQNDIEISKENTRIAALNAKIGQERNDMERQKLGIILDKLTQQRDEKVRAAAASAESGRGTIDNTLQTITRIGQFSDDVIDDMLGPIDSRLPTFKQKTADLEALVDQLGSQAFLSQVGQMKGMGALTEIEGAKLQAAAGNLSKTQSKSQFKANLAEIQRLMTNARKNLATKYGVPDTVPDVPADLPAADELDALLNQYGGQ